MGLVTNNRQTTTITDGTDTTVLIGTTGAKRIIQSAWASPDSLTGADTTTKLTIKLNGNYLEDISVDSVSAIGSLFGMVVGPTDTLTAAYTGTLPTGNTYINISYIEHVE